MKQLVQDTCPLCKESNIDFFAESENRVYLCCNTCRLIYVPKRYFISKDDEKSKYDNHQNFIENLGYVEFLNRLILPLSNRLSKGSRGLDFGSGPNPVLMQLMQRLGFRVSIYDYFYHDDRAVFKKSYDFITATEVIEHLHNPYSEIERLWRLLKPNGYFGIMTAFRPKQDEFIDWYYKRDLTHVIFFNIECFEWLADRLNAELFIPQNGVVILKKRG